MSWLFFALLAPVVLTISNFTDKYIVGSAVKDYRGVVLMQSIVGFIVGTIFWFATGFPTLPVVDSIIVLSTGVLSTFGAAFYFKALRDEDTSYVIFMIQLLPIFVIIFSFLFLKETVSFKQFLGFLIVLLSSLALSTDKETKSIRLSQSFWLLISMDFLFALAAVLIKFAIDVTSFSQILSFESWGIGIGGVILYSLSPTIRKSFNKIIKTVRRRVMSIMFVNEILYVISKSLTYFAYSIGPVALVSVVGSTQVFFGILFGWILTLLLPHIFSEKTDKKYLIKKLGFAFCVILGIFLIS
jgi:drug/metabolite transporter (DMT)-like permease